MGIEELLKSKREEILQIAARHGAYNVRVFGSVARGDARPDSDVDFLVDAGPDTTPFFPGGLIVDLEDLLGRRVEVATERGLRERIRDSVISEAVPL
jgi:predicted nucleotidyltransferase